MDAEHNESNAATKKYKSPQLSAVVI